MPKQTKICRVCGNTYEACNSSRSGGNTFNWREVACSQECGAEYFKRIELSRNPKKEIRTLSKKKKHIEECAIAPSEFDVMNHEDNPKVATTSNIAITLTEK